MKRKVMSLIVCILTCFHILSPVTSHAQDLQLDQLFEKSYQAYQNMDSMEGQISSKIQYHGETQLFSNVQAYLPFKIQVTPEPAFNLHGEAKFNDSMTPNRFAQAYLVDKEFGYTIFENNNDSDIFWETNTITNAQLEELENTWKQDIQPAVDDIYGFILTLSKDPNVQKEFTVTEEQDVFAIEWIPQMIKDMTYENFKDLLRELRSNGVPTESLEISEDDFSAYHEILSVYDIKIRLNVNKEDHLIKDLDLSLHPKHASIEAVQEKVDSDVNVTNMLVSVQLKVTNLRYNQGLTFDKGQHGQLLDYDFEPAPEMEDKEAIAQFKEKAKTFFDKHKSSPDKVTIEDLKNGFNLPIRKDTYQYMYSPRNMIFINPSDQGLVYVVIYENDQAKESFEEIDQVFQQAMQDPQQLFDVDQFLASFDIPEQAPIQSLSSNGQGFSYHKQDDIKELTIGIAPDQSKYIRIFTDFKGNRDQMTYHVYDENRDKLTDINDWIAIYGSYNGIGTTMEDKESLEYMWSVSPLQTGDILTVITDKDGKVLDSYLYQR